MSLYKGANLDRHMDRFEISTLRAYYGALITDKQNELIRLHYDEDISLGELSEMFSVSRQAALDGIKRGEKSLAEFERRLGFVRREREALGLLEDARSALEAGDEVGCADRIAKAKGVLEE